MIFILMVFEFWFIFKYEEVYPAIIMPGFDYVNNDGVNMVYMQPQCTVFFEDGGSQEVNMHSLFPEAFVSMRWGLLWNNFRKVNCDLLGETDHEYMDVVERRLEKTTQKKGILKFEVAWETNSYSLDKRPLEYETLEIEYSNLLFTGREASE